MHNLEIRIIRIFNTYGPRMAKNDGRVVSNFILQALADEDITIYGDGSQTRSFCYVSDEVDGIYKLMQKDGITGPINIGNPDEYTIKQFAEKIVKLVGSNSKIIYEDLPTDDPRQRKPDITLAQEILGWKPTIHVDEGLKKTVEYFKANL